MVDPETDEAGLRASPHGGRRRRTGEGAEASRARNEFGRIKNIVLTVRSVFWACAVFSAVQVLLWLLVLRPLLAEELGGFEHLVTALVVGQVVLTVAGGVFVLRAPLVWTTIGACYWTLDTGLGWWSHGGTVDPGGVFLLFQTFLLAAFWFAVAQAARVQRLMAADPELQLVRRRMDPSRRVVGGVADHARAARVRERQASHAGQLRVLLVVVGGVVVLGLGLWWLLRPPAFAPFAERCLAAWRERDAAALCALFGDGGTGESTLRTGLARRGWLDGRPAPQSSAVEANGSAGELKLVLAEGEVAARCERGQDGWHLVRVALPPLAPGPLAPAIEAFRAAWSAKGTDALVASFRPESRDRLGAALVRLLEKRGWAEQRPELGDVDPGTVRDGNALVLFALGRDELRVRFEYWSPRFQVTGIQPPPE